MGESATVGAPPAIANAVVDALSHLGVRHIEIPITPEKVWNILHERGAAGRIYEVTEPGDLAPRSRVGAVSGRSASLTVLETRSVNWEAAFTWLAPRL